LRFWGIETRFSTMKPLRCSHFSSNSLLKLTGKIFWGSGNLFQVTGNFYVIFLCRSKPSMKSLTHLSTLHLSYKIKCCVDRLSRHPRNGHRGANARSPKSATTRLMHRSKEPRYSITSSARASSVGGSVRPSALAVLRLTTSSNLVGCSIGRSAGFIPFRVLAR
jgi:hypothetical protein